MGGDPQEHDGWFLLRFDANGEGLTDTWHETQDAAKRQATHEYGLEDSEWAIVE